MNKNRSRQYRSNQGRSPKQMRSSYIGAAISGIGLVITIIFIILQNYS